MNILIVDDHPLVYSGLRNILMSDDDIDEVMQANDIKTGLELMKRYTFALALVDMRLKEESGIDFIIEAKAKYPNCKYVVLSSSSAAGDFDNAMQANVDGYILKDAFPDDIMYAVKSVIRGRKYFDPMFLEKMSRSRMAENSSRSTNLLSPRETEILGCLGKGMSNKDIADALFISENTVKKHVSRILTKLDFSDRTQAALFFSKTYNEET
jgi:DNA-binding NarL/FixJ family response regulator